MFRILLSLFILIPVAEIMIFIEVGDKIGLASTLIIVVITAIIGVNLLKQQGFKSWTKIQTTMAQGQIPALEMAAAAQLLFAGGLLLTPGFLTDAIGFILMIPQVRMLVAKQFVQMGVNKARTNSQSTSFHSSFEHSYQDQSSSQDQYSSHTQHPQQPDNSYTDPRKSDFQVPNLGRSDSRISKQNIDQGRTIEGEFEEKD